MHTATAGFADRGAQLGVGERTPDRRRQVAGVALAAPEHGLAVGAGDLGQRATVGGDERCSGAHRLDRGQAEALVEAGDDRQLGFAVQLDDALVGDAGHEVDVGRQPELLDQVERLARLGAPDDGERDVVAVGPQLGDRLDQVGEALERDVGRGGRDQPARHARDAWHRLEQVGVDTDRHEPHALERDAHVGVDVLDRVLADDDHARQLRGDLALHA